MYLTGNQATEDGNVIMNWTVQDIFVKQLKIL